MNIQIAQIIKESIVDGPGIRYVVFTQGCSHNCPGCFNPSTHNTKGGLSIPVYDLGNQIIQESYTKLVTITGGDPLQQIESLGVLVKRLKNNNFHIMIYTGYTWEQIIQHSELFDIVKLCDVLVDGKFEQQLKNISLTFRGSSNQRIIDIQQTFMSGSLVTIDYDNKGD